MNPKDAAKGRDPLRHRVAGAIRRMVVRLTGKDGGPTRTLWQLVGVRLGASEEVVEAEHFLGIGFYSRPGSDGRPEAIVVNVGGANAPAIVAVRDEKTRQAMAGAIKAGETMVYTPLLVMHMKDDQTVEIRTANGTAGTLAFQADLAALAAHVDSLPVGGTGSAPSPPGTAPTGTGTTVLKAE